MVFYYVINSVRMNIFNILIIYMNKVKINIFITTIMFVLFMCILRNILLDQSSMTPVLYDGLFFFVAYGLWKTISFSQDDKNPCYCL